MSCVSRRSRSLRSAVRDWRSFNEIYTGPAQSLVHKIHVLVPEHPISRIHTFVHSRSPEERAAIGLALEYQPMTAQKEDYLSLISTRRFRTEYRDTLNGRFVSDNPRSVAQSAVSGAPDVVTWLRRGLAFIQERQDTSGSEYTSSFHKFPISSANKEEPYIDVKPPREEEPSQALEQELARLVETRKQWPPNEALSYSDHDSMLEEHYMVKRPELRQSEYFAFTKSQSLTQMEKKVNADRKVKHALRFAQHGKDVEGVKASIGP